MKTYQVINESIKTRDPYSSRDEATYYTHELFKHFCRNRDYKYVAIFGYYKNKYGWSDEQALEMYNKAPDAHLVQIIPPSKGGTNEPANFQVLPRKLNIILSNLTDDEAPALLPLLISQFPGLKIT